MDGLLTIREASKRAGISTQALYRRLNTDLKQYMKIIDNIKMLKIEALDVLNPVEKLPPIENNKTLDSDIATIDVLNKQLQVKDKQINDLTEMLKEEKETSKLYRELLLLRKQTSH